MKAFRMLLAVILTVGALVITPAQGATAEDNEPYRDNKGLYTIDSVDLPVAAGSIDVDSDDSSYHIEYNLNARYRLLGLEEYPDVYAFHQAFEADNNQFKFTNTSEGSAPSLYLRIIPVFEVKNSVPEGYDINVNGNPKDYQLLHSYLNETGYGDSNGYKSEPINVRDYAIVNMMSGHVMDAGESDTANFDTIYDSEVSINPEHFSDVINDIAGWVVQISMHDPDRKGRAADFPIDSKASLGYFDGHGNYENFPFLISTIPASDSSDSNPGSPRISGDYSPPKRIVYTPRFGGKSVVLDIPNDPEVLLGSDYEAIKMMTALLALSEMSTLDDDVLSTRLKDYFGFDDCYYYDRSDNSDKAKELQSRGEDVDLASYWIAHKVIGDEVLILIFARGTDGDLQWGSNLDKGWKTVGVFDRRVQSFHYAANEVDTSVAQYISDRPKIGSKTVNFALGGYSRGAGVLNNLAARDSIGGKPVNDDSTNAILFATPNTVAFPVQPGEGMDRITNIIRVEDLVPNVPPLGTKYGTIISDGVDIGDPYKQYYGEKPDYRSVVDDQANFKNHFAELYIADIMTKEPEHSNDWRPVLWFSEYCPTDIRVYKDDVLVASAIDGEVWADEIPIIYSNEDGGKEVFLPNDDSYQVITEATGDGTMELALTLASPLGESENVVISEAKTYTISQGEIYDLDFDTGKPALLDDWKDPSDSTGRLIGQVISVLVSVAFVAGLIAFSVIRRRRPKQPSNPYWAP